MPFHLARVLASSLLLLNAIPACAPLGQTEAAWTGAADFTPPFEQTPGYEDMQLGGWGGDAADHTPRRNGAPIDHVFLFIHGNQSVADNYADYRAHFRDQGFNDSALWAASYLGEHHDRAFDILAEQNSEDLRVFVEAVAGYTGVSKVRIVAHSLGSLLVKDMLFEHRPRGVVVTHLATIASPHGDKTSGLNVGVITCRSVAFKNTAACARELGAGPTAVAWRDARVIADPALEQILAIYNGAEKDIFYWNDRLGNAAFSPRDNIVGPGWPGEIAYSQHADQDHSELKQLNIPEVASFLTDPAP